MNSTLCPLRNFILNSEVKLLLLLPINLSCLTVWPIPGISPEFLCKTSDKWWGEENHRLLLILSFTRTYSGHLSSSPVSLVQRELFSTLSHFASLQTILWSIIPTKCPKVTQSLEHLENIFNNLQSTNIRRDFPAENILYQSLKPSVNNKHLFCKPGLDKKYAEMLDQ